MFNNAVKIISKPIFIAFAIRRILYLFNEYSLLLNKIVWIY